MGAPRADGLLTATPAGMPGAVLAISGISFRALPVGFAPPPIVLEEGTEDEPMEDERLAAAFTSPVPPAPCLCP